MSARKSQKRALRTHDSRQNNKERPHAHASGKHCMTPTNNQDGTGSNSAHKHTYMHQTNTAKLLQTIKSVLPLTHSMLMKPSLKERIPGNPKSNGVRSNTKHSHLQNMLENMTPVNWRRRRMNKRNERVKKTKGMQFRFFDPFKIRHHF